MTIIWSGHQITTQNPKLIHCKKTNVGYQYICLNCKENGKFAAYDGESARNLYLRHKEHVRDVKKKKSGSWMWKHIQNEHEGNIDEVKFDMKVTGAFKHAIKRQINEAQRISKKNSKENLNSKKEYNGHSIKRLKLSNKDD